MKWVNLLFILLLLPAVSAEYFELYEFQARDCEKLKGNYVTCTFKLYSNSSNLYLIETDGLAQDRIRAKSFIYEMGSIVWPSKPQIGAYIFVITTFLAGFLIVKYRHKLVPR
jgi:hypothetical protein